MIRRSSLIPCAMAAKVALRDAASLARKYLDSLDAQLLMTCCPLASIASPGVENATE